MGRTTLLILADSFIHSQIGYHFFMLGRDLNVCFRCSKFYSIIFFSFNSSSFLTDLRKLMFINSTHICLSDPYSIKMSVEAILGYQLFVFITAIASTFKREFTKLRDKPNQKQLHLYSKLINLSYPQCVLVFLWIFSFALLYRFTDSFIFFAGKINS